MRDARGGSLVEYLVILCAVALFCLGAFRVFGQRVDGVVRAAADCLVNFDCRSSAPVADPTTSPTGPVTVTRSRVPKPTATPTNAAVPLAETEQNAVDEGQVFKVETFDFPKHVNGPDDVLRYVLDSKGAADPVLSLIHI